MSFVLLVGKKIPLRDRLILPPQIILEEKNVPNSCPILLWQLTTGETAFEERRPGKQQITDFSITWRMFFLGRKIFNHFEFSSFLCFVLSHSVV